MKICLANVGSEQWVAGSHYLGNLIRALRTLPRNEQPEIVLADSNEGLRTYSDEMNRLVDHTIAWGQAGNPLNASRVNSRLKAFLGRCTAAVSPNGGLKAVIRYFLDKPFAKTLLEQEIELLFPCLRSMGPWFDIPWLPWIPDLQHRHYPHNFSTDEFQKRDNEFRRLAVDAKLVVFSSRDSLTDFDRFFPGYSEKLKVLRFRTVPVRDWFSSDAHAITRTYGLPPRYLVVPNQFWVHKNHRCVFEAVKILVDKGIDVHLACTGHTVDYRRPRHFQELCDYLAEHDLTNRVKILGFVPRQDQIQIMRRAMAVVQPSLFEGWSTVVEDSRALGKRMFLADIAVHREQSPRGAVYFDPHSSEALADALAKEWANLAPGPSVEDEQVARGHQEELVLEYARQFNLLAGDLLRRE